MIGKTLYKAKVRDDKIIMESRTIEKVGRNLYHFNKKGTSACFKSDVGVVYFLTKIEAINFLIKKLERSIDMGEKYVKREKQQLIDAKNFPVN